MAAAVMREAAVAAVGEENHLVLPGVRAQRPAVTENHGLSLAPIFVVDLSAIIGCDRCHRMLSFFSGFSSARRNRLIEFVRRGMRANWRSDCTTLATQHRSSCRAQVTRVCGKVLRCHSERGEESALGLVTKNRFLGAPRAS